MEDLGEANARNRRSRRAIAGALCLLGMVMLRPAALQADEGQLSALVSPGRLARAHAQLEGIRGCQNCHEPGQRVTARRCLTCHKPVEERMAVP